MTAVAATKQIHLALLQNMVSNREGVVRDWDAGIPS